MSTINREEALNLVAGTGATYGLGYLTPEEERAVCAVVDLLCQRLRHMPGIN